MGCDKEAGMSRSLICIDCIVSVFAWSLLAACLLIILDIRALDKRIPKVEAAHVDANQVVLCVSFPTLACSSLMPIRYL